VVDPKGDDAVAAIKPQTAHGHRLETFSKIGQAECANFIADRKIAVEHLFTHRWRLKQAEDTYRVFDQQTSGKGVFVMT
jgi:threonine dehydrogenase-like Zn-dependent dehydrogenase